MTSLRGVSASSWPQKESNFTEEVVNTWKVSHGKLYFPSHQNTGYKLGWFCVHPKFKCANSSLYLAWISPPSPRTWLLALVMLVPWDSLKEPLPDLPLGHPPTSKRQSLNDLPQSRVLNFFFLAHSFTKVLWRLWARGALEDPGWSESWVCWEQWPAVSTTPGGWASAVEKARKAGWTPVSLLLWSLSSGWGQADKAGP